MFQLIASALIARLQQSRKIAQAERALLAVDGYTVEQVIQSKVGNYSATREYIALAVCVITVLVTIALYI